MTPSAPGWSPTSPDTYEKGSPTKSWNAPSNTGKISTRKPETRSKPPCATDRCDSPDEGDGTMTSLELTSSGTAEFNDGEVYFIGNATTLIRFAGLTILTDPAFLHKGEHVDLGHGIWARREVEPACQIADLPPIDLVILSHYHGDHFDDVAAQELDKKLPIVSTADAVDKL